MTTMQTTSDEYTSQTEEETETETDTTQKSEDERRQAAHDAATLPLKGRYMEVEGIVFSKCNVVLPLTLCFSGNYLDDCRAF